MSKQSEKLFDAVTNINDEAIEEAKSAKLGKRRASWVKWAAGGAAAAVVIGLSIFGITQLGGRSEAPAAAGGSGHDEGTVFMSYAGPVLPLTLVQNEDGVTAERNISLDFAPQTSEESDVPRIWDIGVTDSYILSNSTDRDITVTAAYPFIGSFNKLDCPTLTADGQTLDTVLHAGPYSGGFRGAGDDTTESMNLEGINSYDGYSALLTSGEYMEQAFGAYPELTQPVTVYELTDVTDGGSDAVNPTLCMDFHIDYDKTVILTYGFNGGKYDPETGDTARHFSIPGKEERDYGRSFYLIALGEDIGEYTLQGYENGGCEPGTEIEGTGASVVRYETTLGDILHTITNTYYEDIYNAEYDGDANRYAEPEIGFDMYFGNVLSFFARYGTIGTEAKERYDFGMLEDIVGEVNIHNRVFWLTADVTVPAGGTLELEAVMRKQPSFDFMCSGSENKGLMGYDMMTALGSNLSFTSQNASIVNTEDIEIVRQSFGFDLAEGVTSVKLDMSVDHYFIEVREIKREQ